MAFCGQCGQKNPDGAKFCAACGAPLATSVDATASGSQETPSKPERIILHREATPPPPPPRRDSTSQSRKEAGSPWQNVSRNRDQKPRQEEPSRPQRGFEKPAKKGGKLGGCLKKLILWFIGISVLICLLVWGFSAFMNDSGGSGSDGGGSSSEKGSDAVPYECVISQSDLDALVEKKEFKKDNGDVAVRAGRYVAKAYGETITFDVATAAKGNLAGRIHVKMGGQAIRYQVIAYCGNGIYAQYFGSSVYENDTPDEYFQALPDHKTIEWANGSGGITLTYQGPVPPEEQLEIDY